MAKNPNYLKGIFSASMDGGNLSNGTFDDDIYEKGTKSSEVRLYGIVVAQKFGYFKFPTIGNSNLCKLVVCVH